MSFTATYTRDREIAQKKAAESLEAAKAAKEAADKLPDLSGASLDEPDCPALFAAAQASDVYLAAAEAAWNAANSTLTTAQSARTTAWMNHDSQCF